MRYFIVLVVFVASAIFLGNAVAAGLVAVGHEPCDCSVIGCPRDNP